MTATNYIYPFAQGGSANVISTADYAASSITTTTAYVADTILQSAYMGKAQRQVSAICAGVGQFIADNETGTTDVTDDLSPATLAAMIEDAAGNVAIAAITTQPQFDNSTKAATTAFVQRALGNLANSNSYGTNTALTNANVGGIVVPTAGSLGFTLPQVSGLPDGAQITFNGNTFGCVIAPFAGDTILDGSNGAVVSLSLQANDSGILTVIGGQWAVTGGELHAVASSTLSFPNSLTTNGWQLVPGGLILQWGQNIVSSGSGVAGHTNTISLPISWPNGFLTGNTVFQGSAPGNGGTNPVLAIGSGDSLSTVKIFFYASSSLPSEGIFWQAWGY